MIFDENHLFQTLEEAPAGVPEAFAAACAGRLGRPAVEAWREGATLIGKTLDALADYLVAGRAFDREAAEHTLLDAMPDEDDEPDLTMAVVEDALAAAVYALRTTREDPCRNAAWAARRAYETVDRSVARLLNVSEYTPGAERFIDEHPLTIQEVERQNRDMRDLGLAAATGNQARISQVLARSRMESCLSMPGCPETLD
jgi:hypothetical protein